ncbi:hypothetical protein [Blastopirellula retiformator]|uniref:Uncharacterized protein n=1 Tax=Blastopirellula retiformator TaxID=2527970 RepID=A0A5C5UYC6_9BACT|nr:hypothetical protein [Blastopirellula retiformator]TWT31356.1 hypothetical protein Enr8_32770 [Blastopirellula retiformator]
MEWLNPWGCSRRRVVAELSAKIATAAIPVVRRRLDDECRDMSDAEFRGFVRARAAAAIHAELDKVRGAERHLVIRHRERLYDASLALMLVSELLKPTADQPRDYIRLANAA